MAKLNAYILWIYFYNTSDALKIAYYRFSGITHILEKISHVIISSKQM